MNAPLWRVFLADLLTKVENWFITKYGTAVTVLTNSAWAAGNSVDVGMAENAEVLNPMLAQPGNEQIYTTQPAWTFVEDDESVAEGNRTRYQLGSMVWMINDGSEHQGEIIDEPGAASDIPIPIPSLIYDTDGNPHVVFPVWQASGSFSNGSTARHDERPLLCEIVRSVVAGDLLLARAVLDHCLNELDEKLLSALVRLECILEDRIGL